MAVTVIHLHRDQEPRTVELPDFSSVRDLKRHISYEDFNGTSLVRESVESVERPGTPGMLP